MLPSQSVNSLCGRKAYTEEGPFSVSEFRSESVKVEVDDLGSQSLVVRTVSVNIKATPKKKDVSVFSNMHTIQREALMPSASYVFLAFGYI